jgi:hypothetical protein
VKIKSISDTAATRESKKMSLLWLLCAGGVLPVVLKELLIRKKNRDEIVLVYKTGTIKRAVQATGTLIPVQG